MTQHDSAGIAKKLAKLRHEHLELDREIKLLSLDPQVDQLKLTRMKKSKLRLKDWISYFENQLIPDLDA